MLDILRILAAVLALGLGAWLFNRDTNRLVLVPIDRMMQKVRSSPSRMAFAVARSRLKRPDRWTGSCRGDIRRARKGAATMAVESRHNAFGGDR